MSDQHTGESIGSRNILSVDVEDYFQVEAFADVVDRGQWQTFPSRVKANTERVLDLLDKCQASATFFILGWVAERFPGLVQEIVARGHEPACHSYWHRPIFQLTPEQFYEDTRQAKEQIEQASGKPLYGYRAPSFSITSRSFWAFEILAELGFTYDSSIFPVRHDIYGIPDAPRSPFVVNTKSGPIVEYPMTTFRLGGNSNFPVGGGGYLRIFPFWYTRLGLRKAHQQGLPAIVYIHPWELDPGQPRISARFKSRLRHYTNLTTTEGKLWKLIRRGDFMGFGASQMKTGTPSVSWDKAA